MRYFTLLASLPALPDFETARRLPINRQRLDRRLEMLSPGDRAEAARAEDFLTWQRQPDHRTDDEVMTIHERVRRDAQSPTLRRLVHAQVRRRTIQAALRRRHAGHPPPEPDSRLGLPEVLQTVRRNWNRSDFGLGAVHRWIEPMVDCLRAGEVLRLERLLMRNSWDRLEAMMARERPRFSFEAVLIYLFQWDILSRWVAYDATRAQARFEALVEEALDDVELA